MTTYSVKCRASELNIFLALSDELWNLEEQCTVTIEAKKLVHWGIWRFFDNVFFSSSVMGGGTQFTDYKIQTPAPVSLTSVQ